MKINIPGTDIKCDAIKEDLIGDEFSTKEKIIGRILRKAIKGSNQLMFYQCLINDGYVINPCTKKYRDSLDSYIGRCQKELRRKEIYWPDSMFANIYYGKIGMQGEFGYYLEIK